MAALTLWALDWCIAAESYAVHGISEELAGTYGAEPEQALRFIAAQLEQIQQQG